MRRGEGEVTLRTWHVEHAFVGSILALVAALTGGLVAWISAGAVLASFGHASVAERMREREAARPAPSVECHRMLTRYWVAKELGWLAVFALTRAWPAVVGCALFLAYPAWRRWWRARHPIGEV